MNNFICVYTDNLEDRVSFCIAGKDELIAYWCIVLIPYDLEPTRQGC